MAVDITNHLIPYATVKQMLAKAWDEGAERGLNMTRSWTKYDLHAHNPYRDET